MQDKGTTLGDLRATTGNCSLYLQEKKNGTVHRAATFVLEEDEVYALVEPSQTNFCRCSSLTPVPQGKRPATALDSAAQPPQKLARATTAPVGARSGQKVVIMVKGLKDAAVRPIKFSKSTPLSCLFAVLSRQQGVDVEQMRFLHNKQELDGERTAEEVGIKEKDQITVEMRE